MRFRVGARGLARIRARARAWVRASVRARDRARVGIGVLCPYLPSRYFRMFSISISNGCLH